ncbi:MAG: hypothetical protein FNP40_03435 [Dehalobacter sp. 4CP]|uniref:hypothetical protein n=1 Tax=Dehalobacter sp. CP TaxID=2594474 RepID=UPI0013C74C1A|nr:hypothetical protein [Dehalobacter sp. 4CP]
MKIFAFLFDQEILVCKRYKKMAGNVPEKNIAAPLEGTAIFFASLTFSWVVAAAQQKNKYLKYA